MYSLKLKMVGLFSYGKVKDKDVFNKDQISFGWQKEGVRGGYGGESLNEDYFLQNSHY